MDLFDPEKYVLQNNMYNTLKVMSSISTPLILLQQILAHRKSVLDAVETLCERLVDAVGTLLGRCMRVESGKLSIQGMVRGKPSWFSGARYQHSGIAWHYM